MLPSVGRSLHTVNATCAVSGRTRICQQASVSTFTTASSTKQDNRNDDAQIFTATFKPSMGRVEEGVTAGPTYESIGRSGSDRPPAGESAVSFQYI